MKRALTIVSLLAVTTLFFVSCGGGSNSNNPPSGITTRAFVTNSLFSAVQVVDYTREELTGSSIGGGSQPGIMAVTPDHATTIVLSQGGSSLSVITNKDETNTAGPTLPAPASSVVVTSDSKTAYLATRNAPVTSAQNGAVQIMDIAGLTLGTQIPVPVVTNLALSPDSKKLLAFSDQGNAVYFIDLSATTPTAVAVTGVGMSRPVAGVFSSDGTKAYIASCGFECGGTSDPGVSVLDMSTTPPTASAKQQVNGASVIFLDSSNNIYVAGTQPSATTGSLTILTASGSTLTPKAPVTIGGGFHTQIISAPNNKIFIGANNCPDGTGSGCLTMYDTSAGTAIVTSGPAGPVTGMAAVPRSNLVFVVTGGELLTYDTTRNAIFTGPCTNTFNRCFIDIVGQAVDVKIIDP